MPLNAEERRHAEFQGDFKWFIYELTKKYAQALEDAGIFGEKSLARMQDAKLFTEVAHAMMLGIKTTSATVLRALYMKHDEAFKEEALYRKRISGAMDTLIEMWDLHNGPLMRPYHVYGLLLALIHSKNAMPKLDETYSFEGKAAPQEIIVENLARLASTLEDPDNAPKKYESFIAASEKSTNTAANRETRFKWFCRAVEDKL